MSTVYLSENCEDLPDEVLVDRLKAEGDVAHFERIFHRYKKQVYGYCLRMSKNCASAEDLAQEVFIRAYYKIGLFRGGSFRSWLYTIARRQFLNHNARKTEQIGSDGCVGMEAEETVRRDPLTKQEVLSVLAGLSPPQRVCLKLLLIEGLTYKEIASRAGYSEKEVKSYIQNGKRRFRLIWESRSAQDGPVQP